MDVEVVVFAFADVTPPSPTLPPDLASAISTFTVRVDADVVDVDVDVVAVAAAVEAGEAEAATGRAALRSDDRIASRVTAAPVLFNMTASPTT